jgi:hypothetical protein
VTGVFNLALLNMLPKGLGALGYGLDPDIIEFFFFFLPIILGPLRYKGAQSVTLLLRTLGI